jgi:FeS assembly SUF system protein
MTNDSAQQAGPEGAAKLAAANKVTPVQPPIEVDESLRNRGGPGQPTAAAPAEAPKEAAPDLTRLPQDSEGNPRDLTMAEAKAAKEGVIAVLRTIFDPEIPVNIHELGLIYNVSVGLKGDVRVKMTLTSPACPVAGSLPGEVEQKIRTVAHITHAKVELVWDPPWNKNMMSEAAKLELNVM